MKITLYIFLFLFSFSCQSKDHIQLVYPDKIYKNIIWTKEELKKNIAIHHLYHSKNTSTHLIRLKGNEFPHYHDRHDLNISVLSGKNIIHFKDHSVAPPRNAVLLALPTIKNKRYL